MRTIRISQYRGGQHSSKRKSVHREGRCLVENRLITDVWELEAAWKAICRYDIGESLESNTFLLPIMKQLAVLLWEEVQITPVKCFCELCHSLETAGNVAHHWKLQFSGLFSRIPAAIAKKQTIWIHSIATTNSSSHLTELDIKHAALLCVRT